MTAGYRKFEVDTPQRLGDGRFSRLTRKGRTLFHAACARYPRTMARVLGELPLRPGLSIYSAVNENPGQKIPNNVYQTWQIDRFGKTHLAELARFREVNSEYSFHFYDQSRMDEYMEHHFAGDDILDVYRRARFGPIKADIWRYCILWERGGVYFDISKMVDTPLARLISPTDSGIISFERNSSPIRCPSGIEAQLLYPNKNVLNWGLMFAKGHPLLRAVIDGIVAQAPGYIGREVINVKSAILALSGPHHLTECFYRYVETNGLEYITQAGIDFFGTGVSNVPGSYVRFTTTPSYALEAKGVILE